MNPLFALLVTALASITPGAHTDTTTLQPHVGTGGVVQGARQEHVTVIRPRYSRGEYRHAFVPSRGVIVERVTDLRGDDPNRIGGTEVGRFRYHREPLAMSVPASEFVQESFRKLLEKPRASGAPIRVALGIRRFDLECEHGWLGGRNASFRARLEVSVLTDSGEVAAGGLEADEHHSKGDLDSQQKILYRGMVAMAQGFEHLGLGPVGTSFPTAGERSASLPTVTGRYRSRWARSVSLHFAHHSLTGDQMKGSYGSFEGVLVNGTMWQREGRWGLQGETGVLTQLATARVIDPSWTVTRSRLNAGMVPFSVTLLAKVQDPKRARIVTPYVGAGFGVLIGSEALEIQGTRETVLESAYIEGEQSATRCGFEGHLIAGLDTRVAGPLHLRVQGQWTQAGDSPTLSTVDENNADEVAFWNAIHSILERPDFNVTGWRITTGLGWAFP